MHWLTEDIGLESEIKNVNGVENCDYDLIVKARL